MLDFETKVTHFYWAAKGNSSEVKVQSKSDEKILHKKKVHFECPMCNSTVEQGYSFKEVGMNVFTNFNWFVNQEPYLCTACTSVLKDDLLKRRDVIVTRDKIHYLQKKEYEHRLQIIDALFNGGLKPPFAISLHLNYKKHIFPRTVVNITTEEIGVQLEEELVWVNPKREKPIFEIVKSLRENGAANIQIEQVMFVTEKLKKKISEEQLKKYAKLLLPYRQTKLIQLMTLLAKPE